MGRNKNYDEDEALKKAMFLFWRKGYRGVSTRDLAEEMGINQYSLYASFENKDALFERALGRYLQEIIEDWLLKPLTDPESGVATIRDFFEVFVEPGSGQTPAGCFICNTMAEIDNPSAPVKRVVARYQAILTDGFANALGHAYPKTKDQAIAAKASFLQCMMVGIAVKKRAGFYGQPVQEVIDQIMDFVTID
ncbi:MAG: TetR/AcrR family transcriptional regulator [Rhodospirillaceae bacterium]|jgi:TetR/AcrR family transcriptional regulator, transcriptional repressor for nem operon|nr:TetR/AcrR family transcriptional regulator [Rhodospirillaceae bacterium]MBT5565366.1 TetR/AcrR family transcriptional regulator [Rhodospirillaceae bacterium]MBT6089105.1 TetR/AcrR family transcriptional regulator [Rhodospirillaceae bacterium]MBT6960179.1 TetR/AcrR family transcriptional regulator [Rhodospirillaceae bacterium]MBT7449620.1 TetR/AcrR family transcriptional regulator [Rhodospirillaceae bacterium]